MGKEKENMEMDEESAEMMVKAGENKEPEPATQSEALIENGMIKKIPEHRRIWNSYDNTAHKTVIKEGDLNQPRPRFGATGELTINLSSVTGLDKSEDLAKDLKISKYFNIDANTEFEIGSATTAVDRAFETSLQGFLLGEDSHLIFNVFIENNYNEKSKSVLEPFWLTVDCRVHLKSLLNAEPLYKWYPETKLTKAKELYLEGVELFKLGRYLDSFHLFQWAYKLSVFTVGIETVSYTHLTLPTILLV